MTHARYTVPDLLRLMERLRDPVSGCPWDLAQDFISIVPSTLEECYELVDALERQDFPHVEEELGDVLFQVIFYARLGAEKGLFDFDSVVSALVEKLLRRHPHVFAGGDLDAVGLSPQSIEAIKQSWEEIKQTERDGKQLSGLLADIPAALPALTRAQKVQKRAAQVGFDWVEAAAVVAKLEEEIAELKEAIGTGDDDSIQIELGDVLFSCVNVARHVGVDAEQGLRQSTFKFERRFEHMERMSVDRGSGGLQLLSARQMDVLWNEAKEWLAVQNRGL